MSSNLFVVGHQPPSSAALDPQLMATALNNSGFRQRLATFQLTFSSWPELLTDGQLVYSTLYKNLLLAEFSAIAQAAPTKPLASAAIATFSNVLTSAENYVQLLGDQYELGKDASAVALFEVDPATRLSLETSFGAQTIRQILPLVDQAKVIFDSAKADVLTDIGAIVGLIDIDLPFKPKASQHNILHYLIARAIERGKCFDTMRGIAAKFMAKQEPAGPLFLPYHNPVRRPYLLGAMVDQPAALGPPPIRRPPAPPPPPPPPVVPIAQRMHSLDPQVVNYRDKTKAQVDTLNRLTEFLDQGGVVGAGVLSGYKYDRDASEWANPEHFVLLIAALPFFTANAVAYLFWDPDPISTNIGAGVTASGTTWSALPDNFGIMFSFYADLKNDGVERLMLSTAFSPSDGTALYLSDQNYHGDFSTRHRYQVLALTDPITLRRRGPPIRKPQG